MGLFDKLFLRKKNDNNVTKSLEKKQITRSAEASSFLEYHAYIKSLVKDNKYISKKDYFEKLNSYKDIVQFFTVLDNSGMLSAYCQQNGISSSMVKEDIMWFSTAKEHIEQHNEDFVAKEMKAEAKYFDNILKDVEPNILLDEDQRKVILTDEDYCLVVAGAGAGKTTTVAAKVKYLVEKKKINPKQILVVSFTNKAVQELRDKINKGLDIDCPISTFHSVGNAIIHKNSPDEKLNIVEEYKLYFVIRDYFRGSILKNEKIVNKLILFFASYFDAPFQGDNINNFFNSLAHANLSTMKSELDEFRQEIIDARTKKSITIQNEVLRSIQEVEIANFLYLNGIDYDYEPIYQYDIPGSKKPYTPDFIIKQGNKSAYIEHFGINEDGTNYIYNKTQLEMYKKAINDKVLLHRNHKTELIYTFSSYNDGRSISNHLRDQLIEKGFELIPRSNKEIIEKLVTDEENKYIRRLVNLIQRFISNFKVNGYDTEDFDRMYSSTQNVRTRLFLDICSDCYVEYQRYLKENNAVDFQDMINQSAKILKDVKDMKMKLDFKYIIVDEYQDISHQRFDLTKALADVTDAKIIAVGDDWQSIYAFSGSDVTLFTHFEKVMGYAKLLKIVKTYRNSQEVIDIAGNFVQKNKEQIRKTLLSPKTITDPAIIYTYDSTYKTKDADRRTGANYALAHAVETAIGQIIKYAQEEKKPVGTILLLGRFGFDGDKLEHSGLFELRTRGNKLVSVKYPKVDITFMTAHASKGLGYDNVIVVNGKNETYGFPSKIEDDPVLALVIHEDRAIDYAEERRLFYVAMTRTKNRVYFVAPERNPSEFLLELKKDYKNVVLKGNWNEEPPKNIYRKNCPICGFPMQFKYKKSYGLRLYICTNEPELCGFMTNDASAGKMNIMKCDSCRDGFLVIKRGNKNGYFLGCTNYKNDGTGCNNVISKNQYYRNMGYELEKESVPITNYSPKSQPTENNKHDVTKYSKVEDSAKLVKPNISEVIYRNKDLNEVVFTLLQTLQHISERRYYGIDVLISIAKGTSIDPKIKDQNIVNVSEFGELKDYSREELQIIIGWMLENKLILRTRGMYPVLHITSLGNDYHKIITASKLEKLKLRFSEMKKYLDIFYSQLHDKNKTTN